MRFVIGLAAFFALSCPGYADNLPKPGENYDDARGNIIDHGWMPTPGEECLGGGACDVYPEAEACAGTGTAPCVMVWKRKTETLVIHTNGEVQKVITSVRRK